MTPPKITRPAVPEVQHTFPAWYISPTKKVWRFFAPNRGWNLSSGDECDNKLFDVTKAIPRWERLPSGSKIEFTQP